VSGVVVTACAQGRENWKGIRVQYCTVVLYVQYSTVHDNAKKENSNSNSNIVLSSPGRSSADSTGA